MDEKRILIYLNQGIGADLSFCIIFSLHLQTRKCLLRLITFASLEEQLFIFASFDTDILHHLFKNPPRTNKHLRKSHHKNQNCIYLDFVLYTNIQKMAKYNQIILLKCNSEILYFIIDYYQYRIQEKSERGIRLCISNWEGGIRCSYGKGNRKHKFPHIRYEYQQIRATTATATDRRALLLQ